MTTQEQGGYLEVIEPKTGGALSTLPGSVALAQMSDAEFEARIAVMRRGHERMARIQREIMVQETDYGVIPGTQKPTLLKPGAEKLANFYGLVAVVGITQHLGDGETTPPIAYDATCELRHGASGVVVAVGVGQANCWEKRYRYRRAQRACPKCGSIGTVIQGKAEYGGGWLCFAKKGGCGAKCNWATWTTPILGIWPIPFRRWRPNEHSWMRPCEPRLPAGYSRRTWRTPRTQQLRV